MEKCASIWHRWLIFSKLVDIFGTEILKQPNYKLRAKALAYFILVAEVFLDVVRV